MDIKNIHGAVIYHSGFSTLQEVFDEAIKNNADLRGAFLRRIDIKNCKVSGGTVSDCKGYSGLYRYNVWAVLFADGSRWIRMGCRFKSLEEWEKIGIRNSNLSEFPDDGSDASEERVAAFEFAKAAALRMKA